VRSGNLETGTILSGIEGEGGDAVANVVFLRDGGGGGAVQVVFQPEEVKSNVGLLFEEA